MTDLRKLLDEATKGPWICYADTPSVDPEWHIITTKNKLRVIANVHIEAGNNTDEANARLLTMAPDLAAALLKAEEALAFYEDKNGNGYDVEITDYGLSVKTGEIIKDAGDRARATLTEIRKLTGAA